jgi:Polysaccharide deacetylase
VLDRLSSTLTPELDGDAGPFRMLSWDEARALASDGSVTLNPHSVTHPILSRCRDEKVEHEVFESCAALKRETGRAPMVFTSQEPPAGLRRTREGGASSPRGPLGARGYKWPRAPQLWPPSRCPAS